MEDFHQHQVEQAVAEALRLGAISFDAVKMLLLAKLENRPARLDLNFYPYLPAATVGATDTRAYLAYSNASGHAFQYEAGRGFRFDPGHPACFYRSF